MAIAVPGTPLDLMLDLLDQGFNRKAWHGPNLRGSIRGVSAALASWRPARNRHSIGEIVLHAAYWKYIVRRRVLGEKRGSFPLAGSNWFARPRPLSEEAWRADVALLEETHRSLREAIAAMDPAALGQTPAGSKVSNVAIITGIAAHDIYHAGQIQLLKRLAPAALVRE